MLTTAAALRGATKHYKTFALGPVDLAVPAGSILGLIGENGAGKTTALKLLCGAIRPAGGSVELLGGSPADPAIRARIGVVFEDAYFPDCFNAACVGKSMAGIFGKRWDTAKFDALVRRFELDGSKKIKEYSRGMRMKLSLVTALAHDPELLILDEATAGLDPVVRDEILDEFLAFACDEQHSILISSHITSDLEKAADYIAYLHQGKLLLCEEKDRLLEEYGRLVCSEAELSAVDASFLAGVRRGKFSCEALVKHRARFAAAYPHLTVERVGLDDIMVFINRAEKEREAEA